jgi:DNA-binding beta-propeller fold protein YncE
MRILGLQIALLPAVAVCALASASYAQTLLVVNQGDVNVDLIDPASGRIVAAIDEHVTGVHGHEVAASADGRMAYVPIYGSTGVGKPGLDGHEMLVIDIASKKVVGDVDFGHGVRPHCAVFDAAHNLLYVTTELDKSVTVIDAKTLKIVGSVPTGQEQSHMLAISRDGLRGYTANVGPGTVSALDLAGRKTVAVIPVSSDVQRIAISVDDRLVFTADQTQPRLAVIDTGKNAVTSWIALPGVGYGSAATPDGKWLLVTIPQKNEVAVVDLKSLRVFRTVAVSDAPQEVLVRPDGKVAYVSCIESGNVTAIGLEDWSVKGTISAGKDADGLAWAGPPR